MLPLRRWSSPPRTSGPRFSATPAASFTSAKRDRSPQRLHCRHRGTPPGAQRRGKAARSALAVGAMRTLLGLSQRRHFTSTRSRRPSSVFNIASGRAHRSPSLRWSAKVDIAREIPRIADGASLGYRQAGIRLAYAIGRRINAEFPQLPARRRGYHGILRAGRLGARGRQRALSGAPLCAASTTTA